MWPSCRRSDEDQRRRRALGQPAEQKPADAKGLPVVLTTQEARNVRFYRRLGFEAALEEEFPPGITNTIMVREPTL